MCYTLTTRETATKGEVFVVVIIIIITNLPSTDQETIRQVKLGLVGQHTVTTSISTFIW